MEPSILISLLYASRKEKKGENSLSSAVKDISKLEFAFWDQNAEHLELNLHLHSRPFFSYCADADYFIEWGKPNRQLDFSKFNLPH